MAPCWPISTAAGTFPGRAAIVSWRGRTGVPGRAVAARASLGPRDVTIIVARVYGERSAMLAGYRGRIVTASIVGAVAAALLAVLMLRRGLRPLRLVARHAALVRPGTLSRRLEAGLAPSELRPLIDAFNAMLDRLQEGYARLSGFSADLAHEFRTPVANMIGQSQVMLAHARSAAEYEQLVASNIEELERLARMIESMLFLARAHQEEVVLAREPVSALEELERVASFYEGVAEERGVHLACSGAARFDADTSLLRRALANLVSNALRHADEGSTIVLDARYAGRMVELGVTNRGAPIAPEHLAHLFERFYRADPSRSDAEGSTGLGLSIVGAIMNLHGGSASVQADGRTNRFVLAFPAG